MARRQPNARLIPFTGRYWRPEFLTLAQLKAFHEWLNRVIKFREQQERAVLKKKRKTKKRSKPRSYDVDDYEPDYREDLEMVSHPDDPAGNNYDDDDDIENRHW
jgi:hypothetical protein